MGNLRPGRTICRLKCPRHLTISMTDGQIYCLARRSIFSCIWVVTSDRCLNFNTRGGRISGCCPKRLWAKTVICTAKTFLCMRNCILRMWACRRQRDDLMQSIPIQFKPRHAGILVHQQEEYYWLWNTFSEAQNAGINILSACIFLHYITGEDEYIPKCHFSWHLNAYKEMNSMLGMESQTLVSLCKYYTARLISSEQLMRVPYIALHKHVKLLRIYYGGP